MRLEEGMDLAHGQRNPFFWLFPREDAHFGFRREHRALHGGGEWMSGYVIREDQNRVLAVPHEIPCDCEDEVRIGFEHSGNKLIRHRARDLGTLGGQRRAPGFPEHAWIL